MTLINLLNLAKIDQLDPVPVSMDVVNRMLGAAKWHLRDAEFTQNGDQTRFDCAYTTIRGLPCGGVHRAIP